MIVTHILPAVGLPTAPGGVIGNVTAWPNATVNLDAVAVALATVAVGLLWPSRLARYAPSSFVALLAGNAIGTLWFHGAP